MRFAPLPSKKKKIKKKINKKNDTDQKFQRK
jgi:hypothetical protein